MHPPPVPLPLLPPALLPLLLLLPPLLLPTNELEEQDRRPSSPSAPAREDIAAEDATPRSPCTRPHPSPDPDPALIPPPLHDGPRPPHPPCTSSSCLLLRGR